MSSSSERKPNPYTLHSLHLWYWLACSADETDETDHPKCIDEEYSFTCRSWSNRIKCRNPFLRVLSYGRFLPIMLERHRGWGRMSDHDLKYLSSARRKTRLP
jgi:hypothetical protein